LSSKQVEVQIMGQSYLLACPEGGEQRLLEAVERVDTAMCRIRAAGKVKARDRIAVLAALNLAFNVNNKAPALQATILTHVPVIGNDDAADPRLANLMQRLDRALGDDDRLLE